VDHCGSQWDKVVRGVRLST